MNLKFSKMKKFGKYIKYFIMLFNSFVYEYEKSTKCLILYVKTKSISNVLFCYLMILRIKNEVR